MHPLIEILNGRGFRRLSICCLLVGLTLPLVSCSPSSKPRLRPTTTAVTISATQELLLRAMEDLHRLSEFDREQALVKIAYDLNRWLTKQEHDPAWEPDPKTSFSG